MHINRIASKVYWKMGLDAFVHCNCLKIGKTKPYPFDFGWRINQNGILEPDIDEYSDDFGEKWSLLHEWTESCCEHPHIHYASEHIANWFGYRKFLEALTYAGWDHFTTLKSGLPDVNEGTMSPEAARQALKELEYFEKHAVIGANPFLVDTQTSEILYEYSESYNGIFLYDSRSGVDIGFDQYGLFIVERSKNRSFFDDVTDIIGVNKAHPPRRELFRAVRFEQRLLEPQLTYTHQGGKVEYFNADSEDRFICTTAISGQQIPWPDGRVENDQGQVCFDYPQVMHIEERKINPEHFLYIIKPLTKMFQAAIETGNPVVWC